MKKDYLKVEEGSRGEIEYVEWVLGKTFNEIVEIGKKEFDGNVKFLSEDIKEDGELYVEEFCTFVKKKGVGVEFTLTEESSIGYYSEDVVKELRGVNLWSDKNYDLIEEVVNEVRGDCY